MPSQWDDSLNDPRFNEILAAYLQALESGELPDPDELVYAHPEYASELKEFFADKNEIDEIAKRLVQQAEISPNEPTLAEADAPTLPPAFDARHAETMPRSSDRASSVTPITACDGSARFFGDYELVEEIARGGMGVVYKARQINLNRTVALKMILAGQLASQEDVLRFYSEAEAAANLDHAGIVPVYEVGQHDGQHYFSMGFVEGESLADRLKRGPLPPREAASLAKKIAEAIAYAHSRGVIHRDLKPANVLLDTNGEPRVTDFGLAKKMVGDSNLTASGQILGTPAYMPPEQAAGRTHQVKEQADVYSLGAMLYALITGRPPFQADNHLDTLMQVLEQEPAPPRLLNPKVDRDLETICMKCLEKDPQHRYASAQALAEDLGRFVEGESIRVKSLNLLDRVARSLQRSKYDIELRTWGIMLYWFAVLVLLAEIGIYIHALDGPPYPKHWGVAIRAVQVTAMGLVLWRYRASWSVSTGSAQRQMLSMWVGFFVSCYLLLAVAYLLATPECPLDELRIYPHLAIISGLIYFVMGSNYWGQCYVFAVAFFLLALLMPLKLLWAPLEFGVLWAICLILIGRRLRSMVSAVSQGNESVHGAT